MADPLTIGLGLGALVGGGAALFGGKKDSAAATSAPTADKPLPADPSTPAIAPGSKPAKKSQQQSFLSGAAGLQSAAGAGMNTGSSGGKTLLGQ